jgi:hypothetical protein
MTDKEGIKGFPLLSDNRLDYQLTGLPYGISPIYFKFIPID